MQTLVTDWLQAGAAILTFLTAACALIVALKAPRLAAKFAEQYRRESADAEQIREFRLSVFTALMKHRSEILAPDARAAINLVDVAFADVPEVRSARALFMEATTSSSSEPTKIVERYHSLIEAVARAAGFSHLISGVDVRAGYYPEAIGRIDQAAIADAEARIAMSSVAERQKSKQR